MKNKECDIEDGEWIKSDDPRGLRELPLGATMGMSRIYLNGKSQDTGMIKVGRTDPKTGAITIYLYAHRLVRTEEEKKDSFYGLVFYWKPIQVNGEDVARIEKTACIGEGSKNEDSK